MTEHDVVIRGGMVVDGTGAAPRRADVAIDGGRVSAVGEVAGTGRSEHEATGLHVLPGWVDVHTHYDGQVTWDPYLSPSCWQGVTTVVMGNCGVGFAPVRPDRHEWLIALMEGVEDIPGTALHEGIDWAWESFPQYLDAIDAKPHALDVGAQLPHGALRGYVMGDRGADHTEVPTAAEIARMGALAAEAVEAGALGFSTSRTVNHRSADGRHTPSLTASADELVGIARAVGATGKGVLQVVADFVDLGAEFALLRRLAEESGRPISITTLQNDARPSQWRELLDLIAAARADGVTMTGQVAARPVGLIMSFDGRAHPFAASPTFQSLAGLDRDERDAALADGSTRAAIIDEVGAPAWGWGRVFPLGDPPDYDPGPDASIAALAERSGREPLDVAYDALLTEGATGTLYVPVMNYSDGSMAATREMLLDPNTVPGLGDAGAHCTMICDGSFPTYLAAHWSNPARGVDRIALEEIVRRQCRDTARLVGLHDRGTLEPGMRADVNLVDLDALAIGRPEMLRDLPAGGKRLVQRASGYRATLVAGEVVVADGATTGALPGQLIRGAQR